MLHALGLLGRPLSINARRMIRKRGWINPARWGASFLTWRQPGVALAILIASTTLCWAEGEWSIDSPLDDQVFEGDIRSVDVYLRKPAGVEAVLRVTYTNDEGGGEATNLPVGIGHHEIVSINKNGEKFLAGTYRLELFANGSLDELLDQVKFQVKTNPHPVNLPTIDFPYHGHEFPAGISRIRFSGKSPCTVFLGIKRFLKPVFVISIEPHENDLWSIDIPWSYGRGGYNGDLFLMDPSALKQVAEDGTTFTVLGGEDNGVELKWQSYLPIQR